MNLKKKVGIIGFGMAAERFHAPLLSVEPRLELRAVVERHKSRSQSLYPEVALLRTSEELFESDVDLVVILTPNESHFCLAKQALLADKHVVLDKPMTVTSAEADELIALAKSRGKLLSVFHNRRWDSDFLTLQEILRQDVLGSVLTFESNFDRFRPRLKGGWKEEELSGSGVLYDLGSHLLDQCFQLFGVPKAVLADLRIERDQAKAHDSFLILLDYGVMRAELKASCLAAEPKVRYRVRGSKGTWVKYDFDPQEEALANGALPSGSNWGKDQASQWGLLYSRGDQRATSSNTGRPYPSKPGNYPAYYQRLAAALCAEEPLPVEAADGRRVVRAIELCSESAAKRCWVDWQD